MPAIVWTLAKVYADPYKVVYAADITAGGTVDSKNITCTGAATPDLIADTTASDPIGRAVAACKTPAVNAGNPIDSQAKAEAVVYGGKNPITSATSDGLLDVQVTKSQGTGTAGADVSVLANTNAGGSLLLTVSALAAAACRYHITIKAKHSAGR